MTAHTTISKLKALHPNAPDRAKPDAWTLGYWREAVTSVAIVAITFDY
jgi:hypothetical protein